jgi:hypothetical protein
VLYRDGFPEQDPRFFAPAAATFLFSLESLVVGSGGLSGTKATGVRLSALRGGALLAAVDLAASPATYLSYTEAELGLLRGLTIAVPTSLDHRAVRRRLAEVGLG